MTATPDTTMQRKVYSMPTIEDIIEKTVSVMLQMEAREKEYIQDHERRLRVIEKETKKAQEPLLKDHAKAEAEQAKALDVSMKKLADSSTFAKELAGIDYLDVGSIQFSHSDNTNVRCIVPFLGKSNVLISASDTSRKDDASSFAASILANAIKNVNGNHIELTIYDPHLTGTFKQFSRLGKTSSIKYQSIVSKDDMRKFLLETAKEINTTSEWLVANNYSDFLDYRHRSTARTAKPFRIIAIADYDQYFDQDMVKQLNAILQAGSQAGVSTILACTDKFIDNIAENVHGSIFYYNRDDPYPISTSWHGKHVKPDYLSNSEITRILGTVKEDIGRKGNSVTLEALDPPSVAWDKTSIEGIEFAIGEMDEKPVLLGLGNADRGDNHHVLITGATGSGKSNALKHIVLSMSNHYSPAELELYLLDLKEGTTFNSIIKGDNYLPQVRVLGSDTENPTSFSHAVLEKLDNVITDRAKKFQGVDDNIASYRKKTQVVMPRIVLIVDEFHVLFESDTKEARTIVELLENLLRKGQAYGIHIILTSQALTSITSLAGRREAMLAQMPTRIAFSNSATESFMSLSQGNDAAAHIQRAGQAILNTSSSHAKEDNKLLTVGKVTSDYAEKLLAILSQRNKAASQPVPLPIIFTGNQPSAISAVLKEYPTKPNHAVLGVPVAIERLPLSVELSRNGGANIAIIGSGIHPHDEHEYDLAVGTIQAIAASLAYKAKTPRFSYIGLLSNDEAARTREEQWISSLRELGAHVDVIEKKDAYHHLQELSNEISNQDNDDTPPRYIFAPYLGRLDPTQTDGSERLDTILKKLLVSGSAHGIHIVGHWHNVDEYTGLVNLNAKNAIDTKVILGLDENAVQGIVGYASAIHWASPLYRALVKLKTGSPYEIVPFAPIKDDDLLELSAKKGAR